MEQKLLEEIRDYLKIIAEYIQNYKIPESQADYIEKIKQGKY